MSNDLFYGVGIFIPVSNLEKSSQWYEEMLGFKLLHSDEPLANTYTITNGSVIFTLVKSENIIQPKFPKNDYEVGVYFNFLTKAVEEHHTRLLNKGVNVTDIIDYGDVKGFSIIDLDGNRFGIVT